VTPIAVRASIPNPFERFSRIAFRLIMALTFTGALREGETVCFLWRYGRKKSFFTDREIEIKRERVCAHE
jgi:hypothetical protein